MPKTGTSVSAKRRSALRIVPSPPRTRHASGCPSRSSREPTPSAAAPCLERSASPATSSHPASPASSTAKRTASVVCSGWVCERSATVLISAGPGARTFTARPPAPRARSPRRRGPSPPRVAHRNVSSLPFGPGQVRRGEPADREAELGTRRVATAHERLAPVLGGPDDARLDASAAELELRLHHREQLAIRREALGDRGDHLRERDERDVDRRERGLERQVGRRDRARVGALDHVDARVVSKRPLELSVRDVERDHARGAALKQAVGEAAGRGADVEAVEAGHVEAERVERVRELDPAPRYIGAILGDAQLGVGLDQLARLGDARAAGADQRRGPARIASAARARERVRPRSAITVSARFRVTAGKYRPKRSPWGSECDGPHTCIAHTFVSSSRR